QLRGQAFDRRVDIWAFGCTVFEMLSGRAPFQRATDVDSITAILQDEPDWNLLPAEVSPAVRLVLERCLEKDARQRLRDVADARFDDLPRSGSAAAIVPRPVRRIDRIVIGTVAALAAVTAAVVLLPMWWRSGTASDSALRKFEVMVEGLGQMPGTYVGESGPGAGVSISPDGRRIVYPRDGKLWMRDLSQLESRPIDGTDGAVAAAWSPDGESLAFAVLDQVRRVPTRGGTPMTITTAPGAFVEAGSVAWAATGTLAFTTGNGPMFTVPSQGGDAALSVPLEQGERDFHDLVPLPNNRGTLFVTHMTTAGYAIDVVENGTRRRLFGPRPQVIRHPIYSSTGHILYQRVDRNPGIWAVPVDASTLVATGEPFLVAASGLRPSLAADGTLVFVTDERWGLQTLSLVDRTGTVVRNIGAPLRGVRQPALSKDDRRVAVMVQGSQTDDVWTYDVATGQATQVTFDGARGDPAWDPTSDRLAYSCGKTSREGGTCVRGAHGTGEASLVIPRASMASYAPDGLSLVHVLLDPATRTDIFRTRLAEPAAPALLVRTDSFDYQPRVSPDGRYLAYGTSATGRPGVFVTTFPEAKGRWHVSPDSGAEPQWNPAGGELFYVDAAGRLQAVPLNPDGAMPPGPSRPLFGEAASSLRLTDGYAPSAKGDWFVVVRDADRASARPRITVVQNWFTEFRTP
ncbi:MAG: PD40 domain-containing protein, partial [Acidobacteria bacterium]|nr:PD40 domain-containing protein [Acidobacteriota bacterium]